MKALRILVVEDNAVIGALLAETLEDLGHDVCAIEATQADAVAAAAKYAPDLMIVDAQLSNGSGVAAVVEVLRRGPMPHLFMSGVVAGINRPGAVVLQKPFRGHQLQRAILAAMGEAVTV